MQKYEQDLFKMAMPCLSAIAGALPPDYIDSTLSTTLEKQVSVDTQGNFDPRPINTAKYVRQKTICRKTQFDPGLGSNPYHNEIVIKFMLIALDIL